jgi:hypothetical protein
VRIRPFEPADAPAVSALWRYWFRDKRHEPADDLAAWVRRIHVERPGGDPEVVSLVAEDEGGEMLGFLGVSPTPVLLDGREATLAGVFPSVVAPEAPGMVATLLLRKLLKGPQALTLSDGGHVKFERIWEGLGGAIAPTASLRWIKVLRPTRLVTSRLIEPRWAGRVLAPVWRPMAAAADAVARAAAPARLRPDTDRPLPSEPLEPEGLIEAVDRVHARARMRPAYAPAYLRWLFDAMSGIRSQGTLARRLLRDDDGRPVGWWVAYLHPGGVSRVFALDGAPAHLGSVVDDLFAAGDAAGVGALIGRLEPRLRRPLAARRTFAHNGGSLQMVHARDASLRDDALLGRLAFSRLEGENWYWWRIVSDGPTGDADAAPSTAGPGVPS